jgi:uncharacterized protein YeeX (DUF496 family)
MSNLDFQEWRLKRARGAIEEYIRGVKKRATDINWVMGVLKGAFGVSKEEALRIIESIKNDKSTIFTPERIRKLEELESYIKSTNW